MSNELNRIRELSGLQQEAPASGDQALANELSMYFAKLAKEMLQNMQRPNTNDLEYEEFVNIAQAFKGGIQAGLDEVNTSDFEFSSNPFGDFGRSINDGPDEELVKILAKYGYRPGPDGDNDEATIVKQQEETAVQEAPAVGDQAKVQALLTWFTNKYNEYKQALINQEKENGNKNIQAYLDNNDELGELEDIISSLKTGNMQQAIDSINNAKFEFSGIPGDGDDFFQVLSKLGIPKKTFWFGETEESAVQPMPVLNAVKETPAISQVDEAIKKATAQLKSFSNFDGLKPYKPKKK
jgi:hypothetical protein